MAIHLVSHAVLTQIAIRASTKHLEELIRQMTIKEYQEYIQELGKL